MYKVFINDRVICFTNNEEIVNTLSNCLIINFFSEKLVGVIYQRLKKAEKLKTIIINVADYENAFLIFKSQFKIIKAAGGLVKNVENEILFIYRLGKWDLPKGKIEKEESDEAAAIREVQEECGLPSLNIVNKVADTFHIYELGEKVILKQTFWYTMETEYVGELVPQLEEDITEAVWYSKAEIDKKVLPNTYASIKELILTTFL